MAGGRPCQIGNFTADPYVWKVPFDDFARRAIQFGNGQNGDAGRWGHGNTEKREFELSVSDASQKRRS